MKTPLLLATLVSGLWLAGSLLLVGCKTTPPVDWNSRVGNYTYDQAVTELGPPDKSAQLSDGVTVAEWITGRRSNSSVSIGTGFFSGGRHSATGFGVGQTFGGGYRDVVLRLTFSPDNRLISWVRNY
jgi:hypothetical protein